MKLIGIVRLGRDAEQRYTPTGASVVNFSGAFNFGKKDAEGRRPSQWVEFALWGDRGEKLLEYLTKGSAFLICAREVHIETFEKRDGGQGSKLVATVDDVEFVPTGPRQEGAQGAQSGAQAPTPPVTPRGGYSAPPARQAPAKTGTSFDDLDDDIPFILNTLECEPRPGKVRRLARADY